MKYKYDIIRSARKSISVTVANDNTITVRCPWSYSSAKINEFLDSKQDWLDRVVLRNAKRLAANDDVIELKKVYFMGKKLPLERSDAAKITDEAVFIKDVKDLEKLYTDKCGAAFMAMVDDLAKTIIVKPASVKIKDYKSMWGCCDSANNIVFNYKIFMLPPELQRYVAVHELCHIICHNHSPAFWKLVGDYQPDFKVLKKWLTNFDILTKLY